MSEDQKIGLMAHATTPDAPSISNQAVSAALRTMITSEHIRYGLVTARSGPLSVRATWANNVQELCEESDLGIPFVLSMEPAHSTGGGRTKVTGFSTMAVAELGLAASGGVGRVEGFGEVVSEEYRLDRPTHGALGAATWLTEPRWHSVQFGFGEDSAQVSEMVSAYVEGLQGTTLGANSVAAVVGQFPAPPAEDGRTGACRRGSFGPTPATTSTPTSRPSKVPSIRASRRSCPRTAFWRAAPGPGSDGLIGGSSIEQVGASFNETIIGDVLRGHYGFDGWSSRRRACSKIRGSIPGCALGCRGHDQG